MMKLLDPTRSGLAALVLMTTLATPAADRPVSDLDLARRLNRAFVEVAEKASPSVVVINVLQKIQVSDLEEDSRFEGLPPGFWRRFHEQFPQDVPTRGEGSGVIIRPDGYILTNRHVVEDAQQIEVKLRDGRTFKATVRGVDPQSDVAVIKIDATGLPIARLADSNKTKVGEFAIAIGAPFSLDYSVTFGHVSAKGRGNIIPGDEGAAMDQDFIQTDANINPGNSGGPLVNVDGEVIGINTLVHGLRTGIGFAVPSNLAREVSDQLIAEGKFTRAWLGIQIRALRDDPELISLLKGVEDGVVVSVIVPDGPAAKSDLKPGDVITAVEGRKVSTPQQLREQIRTRKVGQPVSLSVVRAGKPISVKISPAEWKQPEATTVAARKASPETKDASGLGMVVKDLTPDLASQFGVERIEGVIVTSVEKDSVAARKGLKPGDVITSLNQQPTGTPAEFHDGLAKADLKKGVIVNLISGSTARFEILKISEP